jgi:hypothetical protein
MLPPASKKMSGPPPSTAPQGLTSLLPQEGRGGGQPPQMGGAPPFGGPEDDGSMPPQPNPEAGGATGGLKDVFDELQDTLDALASILPDQAEAIDEIGSQLAEILAKAISGGAPFQGRTEGAGEPRPNSGLPI